MTTNTPRYSNLKNIPTVKIEEILNSAPYYTTDKGTDYGPVKEELERILWERQGKEDFNFPPELPVSPSDILDRTELICEIREEWKVKSAVNDFGFYTVAIPPRIMNF